MNCICDLRIKICNQIEHDVASIVKFLYSSTARETAEKIGKLATQVFSYLAAGLLFFSHATLFSIGFTLGVCFPKHTNNAVQRIIRMWHRLDIPQKMCLVGAACIAWPISSSIAALCVGGFLGKQMSQNIRSPI